MADIKTNQSKVYNALKGMGFSGIGASEQDFAAKMSNPKNRAKVYKALSERGYKGIGKDQAAFDTLIYEAPAQEQAPVHQPAQKTQAEALPQRTQQPAAKPQQAQQPKQTYNPTWQEQWAMGITLNNAGNAATNATEPIDQRQQNAEVYQQKSLGQTPEIGRAGRVVSDQGGYIDEEGTRHNVMVDANARQRELESTYTDRLKAQLDAYYGERSRLQKEIDDTPQDWVDADGRVHSVSAADKQKRAELITQYQDIDKQIKELNNNPRIAAERENDPGFLGVTKYKLGAGFAKAGLGLLNTMEALAGGMIVEDASSPTGYSRAPEYDPINPNNAVSRGLKQANEYVDDMSRKGEVRGGRSFTDLLLDGDIGGNLLKGWGTGLESAPMTLSAYNPYTMALNAISMAGNNFRDNTIENPDIPGWKRAAMAVGSAAIEQAVEKYADPIFKYIGGGSKKVTQEVVDEATKTIAGRIKDVLKDAAGEGAEEVITNFGNDVLGQSLDWLDGESDYGIMAQWRELKKHNPDADLGDFAMQKAKENIDAFFGGALAGAYTSGGAQATVAGLQYAFGGKVSADEITSNPNQPVHPATVDIAQSFDRGFAYEKDEDKYAVADRYTTSRQQALALVDEETLNKIDRDPMQALGNLDQYGLDTEGQQVLGEYIGSKAEYDGMQQRIIEDHRASRPNYVVNGNNIDEMDAEGNVIATHEYDNVEDMKAGMWELQAMRDYSDMQADISMVRHNPKYDYDALIAAFAGEEGMTPDEVKQLLYTSPLERSEEADEVVSRFAELLHNTLYDSTEVHEEQSAQDGASLADAMSIDLNNLSPEQTQQAAQLTETLNTAKQALDAAFAANEDLAQEVQRMEQQGMPHQGIISSLDSFRPEEVQTVIDFYNAQATYQGFINQMGQKIDEEAANSRKRHTLNGTINGQADVRNVYTITDGTNEYYLVSGDITTDPATGRITGSTSGLIIGMDLDGSFVQLGDGSGYSLMQPAMTLDQFEEQERIRLQEQVSAVVDPNGTMVQQQAGANTGTGADETPTPAPVAPTTPINPPSPSGEAAGTPALSIESVTDKDGIKRYENGVSVDDAIADIQADGFDVGEVADASIGEAQAVIDKINGKQTKSRKDLMDRKKAQGVIDYYQALKERAAMLSQQTEQPANGEENVNNQPEQPASGGNVVPSQPGPTVEELKQERIKALKAELGELFDDDFTKANDVFELVSMWIGRKRNLAWDDVNGKRGLQKELGWTRKIGGDTKYIETLLAKKGEGVGVDEFVHMVWESPENSVGEEKRWTTEEIKEALLDLLKSAESKSDVVDYAVNTRERAARAALEEQQRQAEEEALQKPVEPLTDEDVQRITNELPFEMPKEGEDIPDAPITKLMKEVDALQKEDGTPSITLVDTDRVSKEQWRKLAEEEYGGAFLDDKDVEDYRRKHLEDGVFYNPETGKITVFSGGLTPEELRKRIEIVKEYIKNGSKREEAIEGKEDFVEADSEVERGKGDAEAGAEGQGQGRAESDGKPDTSEQEEYLKPRNEKEEKIVADVMAQLQQEIDAAIKARDKAANDLQKAQAKESDRATDMFSDDEAFQEPDQLFSFDEMGGTDRTQEGVNRRTSAERKAFEDAKKKVDQLQSEAERNSRIRGALDNERRQTSFTPEGETSGTVTGQPQSREEYLASHPLTEAQIMADTEATEDEKLNAIDFLRGEDDSAISRFYYDAIYERAQKQKGPESRPASRWQYEFHYDKETGRAWITRDDVSGGIPIGDGRFRIEGKSLAELRAILENPANNLGELLKEVEAELHNAEVGEELRKRETDPMAAIEQAASSFREEQSRQSKRERMNETQEQRDERKRQNEADIADALKEFNDFLDGAKGSSVLDKFMRKGLEGNDKAQANLLDAFTLTNAEQRKFLGELLRLASKVGYAYIKSGVYDVQAWSRKMADGIGQKLKEVFGWEDDVIGEFVGEVWQQKYTVDGQRMRLSEHAERLKNGNSASQTVNEHKNENNEPENVVSSQQKPASELEGDSAKFVEREQKITKLRNDIHKKLKDLVMWGDKPQPLSFYKGLAKDAGLSLISDTDLQEIIEAEVVNLAREFANKEGWTDQQKFNHIVKLYEKQPSLNARDNDRINKQQYSTPAPMAYLMGKFLKEGKEVKSGLEPSAGNGMLTLNLPKEAMHVNDIDEMRLSNLAKQGFGEVTSQDGTQPFGEKKYDVVVTNPPFGSVPAKTYDGYTVTSLEQQMVLNALESMKDDGRAAIIIGGNTEYKPNGSISGKDKAFLNYLYSHYNVVDVINCDGKALYSRQGTGYDVRMILIKGRKQADNSFAPVKSKARAEQVKSYDELYKRVNDDILSDSNKSAGVHDTASGESNGKHDNGHAGTATETGVRNVRSEGGSKQRQLLDSGGQSVSGGVGSTQRGTDTRTDTSVGGRNDVVHGTGSTATQSSGSAPSPAEQGGNVHNGRNDSERPDGRVDVPVGGGSRPSVEVRRLGTEKVPYRQQSKNPYSLQSQMPAEQAEVVKKALEELGDVDEFLVKELGYSSVEDLYHGSQSPEKHGGLAAEQIDSVAMAIHQMNEGNAFIIGDQTGIGKGRQAAALIRYGVKKGGCPVFITVKKGLFSDMYRDLCDIGSPGLRPFIWSADDEEHSADVTDKNGNVVYKRPSDKEQKRVVDYINKYGKLPPEYDYIITTYDSFKGGTMVYEEGVKKDRNFGKKSPTTGAYNSQAKRDALEVLAQNSYVIMDESHNAGGETSAVSGYLQYITTKAKGVTFLSATFAKRPGNMPIYSLKTAIAKAGVKIGELIDAVKQGGATFQEIMSKALTEAGQMIRRERDMTGVTIDWKGIEDEAVIEKQRQQYDTIIGLFNDIIDFQRRYVDPIVNKKNDEAAEEQGEVDHTPGTRDMGINNTPFASRTYNMVQQVLLSLKAEEAAKRAIEHLKQGHKPVIALANTNEGAADEVSTGEDMEMPDLSVNLKKGLQGTLRITKKDAFGNSTNEMIPFDELSEAGQARYREIMDAIENASSGLSLSPIDVIKNELKKAGYKVGELTGRKQEFVYNEDGTVKRVKRQDSDKKKVAADFNNGKLDALILNKSAGTGISLHASSKFDDQRQRVMIVAQAQGDVNDEVQIRGRIDRTGQVLRGMYEYVVSQIPSEQRLLMMLKAKLRSLDANTTSSQKSKFNEMQVQDIINKYGDDIVIQYLAEHPDLAAKMVDPPKWGEGFETMPAETLIANASKEGEAGKTASKVLGRMALLKVAEQEKMLQEIGDLYQAEIDRLNEMGENDLEITEMPLRAKTLGKEVWEEGVEPGGKNPFADNSYVEEVEMDVLKKPMKAEEVKKSQARLLGGKTWDEYKKGVLDKLDAWEAEKKREATETITARAEKKAQAEKEKYIKGAKKAQEKNQMTDAEIERNGTSQYATFYAQEMAKLDDTLEAIEKQKQTFVDALETFTTDGVYALPTDIYDLGQLSFEPSFGKVIDIKISDNFSTAASTISFATLDGRRKITIPISGMVKQVNGEKKDIKPIIVSQTTQTRYGMFGSNVANTLKVLEQNVDNWDKLTSTATRKKGYIITGNLLKALTSLQKQHQGGKLISYTTDTGEIRQGVLMGDHFDPGALTSQNPISSVAQILKDGGQVVSADGDVIVTKTDGIDWAHTKPGRHTEWMYELGVPKSKKRGEKYFNDETLLSLMDDQFEGTSRMRALFPERNLDAVLKRLDELGVTVETRKVDDNDMNSGYSEGEAKAKAQGGYYNRFKKAFHFKTEEDARKFMESVNASERESGREFNAETMQLEDKSATRFRKGGEQNPVEADYERNRKAGEKLAKSLNMDFEAVTDQSQIKNKEVLDAIAAGEEPTGWIEIDEKTGKKKIYMYLPNVRDRYEAEKTIAHETVGHYGLRELLGEKGYKSYMRSLVFDLKTPELSKYIQEHLSENGFDMYRTVDEFLADAAEKGYGDLSMWQKVKDSFTDAMRSAGFTMAPSISDVKYMVWLSKHNLEKGNVVNEAQRQALLFRLGKERYEAKVKNGEFVYGKTEQETNAPYFPGNKTLFRHTPSAKYQKHTYERALKRFGYVWKEAHIDAMQSAVELMRAISGVKKIEDIPSAENFVLLENQMSSKEEQMDFLFNRDYMEPLDKAVSAILPDMGKGVDEQLRNLQLYMIKKHGLERNRYIPIRDAIRDMRKDPSQDQKQVDQLEQDYEQMIDDNRQDLRDGTITLREYFDEIDTWIKMNIDPQYKAGDKDYSGLGDMMGTKGSYDDSSVIDDVMSTEAMIGEERINNLWEKTKAVSQFGLDTEYEGGLDSKEKHDKVSRMFEWYVPLRGYDEKTSEEVYDYLEERGNDRQWAGPVLMNAKGRESLGDVDVFATLGSMSSSAINRALRNQMKQAFARFVRNHYNSGGVEADERLVTELPYLWAEKQYDPTTGQEVWVEKFPDIPENAKADDIAQILDQYQQDMKAKEGTGDAKRIRQNSSIPYRPASNEHKAQHIVDVWINGEKHAFIVNGNPRAAQAINGQLKAETNHRQIARFTRFMAQLNTSYNPDFIVGNTERDYIFSAAAVGIKENASYFAKWQKNYFTSVLGREALGVPGMHTNLFKRYRDGKLNMSNETDRYFKEFMENGGETGWVETKNLEKWRDEIRKGVKKQGSAEKIGKAILVAIPEAVEAMNERAENMARFATYMTSRQSGRTITRSISDAKEISVNFNRKGAGLKTKGLSDNERGLQKMNTILAARTAQFGQDYLMFYNAGVQGLNNASKLFRDHPIKASTAFAGFALGAILMAQLNQSNIDDEDPQERGGIANPYAELPEWIRRNRLCMYVGKGEFVTVDLPIELRAMYGIGDIAAAYTMHPELRSEKLVWQDVLTQLTQILPVDFMGEHPGEPWMSFVPSTAMPLAEAAMNMNWYGRKIEKDQYVDEKDPRWTRTYRNTNKAYLEGSKQLNASTNKYSKEDLRQIGVREEDLDELDANIKGAADGKLTDPAIVEHIVNGYFGGAAQTAGRIAHIMKSLGDEPISELAKSNQMPILRRLHYSPTEQNKMARTRNKWWYYKDEMDEVYNEVKLFKDYGVDDPLSKMKQIGLEDSVRATRAELMKSAQKDYKKLKSRYDKALKRSTNADLDDETRSMSKSEADSIQMRIDQLMENTVTGLDKIQ